MGEDATDADREAAAVAAAHAPAFYRPYEVSNFAGNYRRNFLKADDDDAAAEAPARAPAAASEADEEDDEFTEMCNELIEDREEILRDIHERGVDMAATLADLGSQTHAVEIEGLEVTVIQEAEAAMALDHELVTFHSVRALQVWLFLQWSAFLILKT